MRINKIKLTTQKINTHKVYYYPIKNQFELKVEKKIHSCYQQNHKITSNKFNQKIQNLYD